LKVEGEEGKGREGKGREAQVIYNTERKSGRREGAVQGRVVCFHFLLV